CGPDDDLVDVRCARAGSEDAEPDPDDAEPDRRPPRPAHPAREHPDPRREGKEPHEHRYPDGGIERRQRDDEREESECEADTRDDHVAGPLLPYACGVLHRAHAASSAARLSPGMRTFLRACQM